MLTNTSNGYGLVSIVLHWFMALALVGMFALGLYMVELTYYDAWYRGSLALHKSVGMALFAIWGARLVWRMVQPTPKPIAGPRWQLHVAHIMHWALYGTLLLIMISGFLISTADGRALEVFGYLAIPALPFSVANQEDIAGQVHAIAVWTLLAMVAIHAAAAIKHHFIDKDTTLIRMLKVTQRSNSH